MSESLIGRSSYSGKVCSPNSIKVKGNNQEASTLMTLGFQGKYRNKYKTRPNVDNHQGSALSFDKRMEVVEST